MKKIYKTLFALMLACMASTSDVNGDTIISIADVTALVNIILGKTPSATDSSDIVDDPPAWEPANAPKRHADDGQDDNNGNNAKTREQRKLRK